VPVTLAAVLLSAGNHPGPAYAAPCPTRAGSASATPTTPAPNNAAPGKAAPGEAAPGKAAPGEAAPGEAAPGKAAPGKAAPGPPTTGGTQTPGGGDTGGTADGSPDPGTGNPIADAWNGLLDGLKKLVGGDDPAPPPADPPTPGGPGTVVPPTGPSASVSVPAPPRPSASVPPRLGASRSASPTASPTGASCRVDGVPLNGPVVGAKPALLTGDKQVMTALTYRRVVELPTAGGRIRALEFTMTEAVTEAFRLRIAEAGGKITLITSNVLTISGQVSFYTTKFVGKLEGVIPQTYTPDSPPPLIPGVPTPLPVTFTDVTIDLAFVTCDTLTAGNLHIVGS
jgi:hypothetical protein